MLLGGPALDAPKVPDLVPHRRKRLPWYPRPQRAAQDAQPRPRTVPSPAVQELHAPAQRWLGAQPPRRVDGGLVAQAPELVVPQNQKNSVVARGLGGEKGGIWLVVGEPADVAGEEQVRRRLRERGVRGVLLADFEVEVGQQLDLAVVSGRRSRPDIGQYPKHEDLVSSGVSRGQLVSCELAGWTVWCGPSVFRGGSTKQFG
ncbi:hypothetical protein LEL_00974 [Akanthomyces lecanii RCEF 1005]|uniref:Uncharacterized protein n=1 Tax=Akanthomyces lecanii RCEF 1005 TaxID=1081108 RepID=A0A168KA65_CORDF|nr:hypothetical protein LEL_00974 [Akanthomyces lecanii RCEF 1005]